MIDIVEIMKTLSIIDPTGKINAEGELKGKVQKNVEGQNELVIFDPKDDKNCDVGVKLVLTQDDVRQIQLAKGAIAAGITVLLEKAGIKNEDITKIYFAGALGSKLSTKSLRSIGLIPQLPNAEMIPIGNAAGAGAVLALISKPSLKKFQELAKKIEYIELATTTEFNDYFIESMKF